MLQPLGHLPTVSLNTSRLLILQCKAEPTLTNFLHLHLLSPASTHLQTELPCIQLFGMMNNVACVIVFQVVNRCPGCIVHIVKVLISIS